MKHFKLFATCLMVACASVSFVFTSCEEGGYETFGNSSISVINAKVEDGEKYNSKISVVKMTGNYDFDTTYGFDAGFYSDQNADPKTIVLATGTYSNGGFTINLPATVDEKYLSPIVWVEEGWHEGGNVKCSDSNAKCVWVINILGFSKQDSDREVVVFYYEINSCDFDSDTNAEGHFVYVDRNVTITGSGDGGDKYYYNVSLKKGWNIYYGNYGRQDDRMKVTNNVPSGLKWWGCL
jgi:hypothetical protein